MLSSLPQTVVPRATCRPVRARSVTVRASTAEAPPAAPAKFVPPPLDPNTPSPIFGGSTGGLLRKAQVSANRAPRYLGAPASAERERAS